MCKELNGNRRNEDIDKESALREKGERHFLLAIWLG